jgi:hypothetical protein
MSPVFFFAYPLVGLVLLLVGLRVSALRAASSVRPGRPFPRAEDPRSRCLLHGSGPCRGGQLPPLTAAGQERWAREMVRCAGGRVDAAPVRCPRASARAR